MERTIELREKYLSLRRQRLEISDLAKKNSDDLRSTERELIEAMLGSDVISLKSPSGCSVSIRARIKCSLTLATRAPTIKWLESLGHQREDFVRDEIIPERLRSIVRDVYEREGKVNFPEFLKFDDSPTISVYGLAGDAGEGDGE